MFKTFAIIGVATSIMFAPPRFRANGRAGPGCPDARGARGGCAGSGSWFAAADKARAA